MTVESSIEIVPVTFNDPNVLELIAKLDAYQVSLYGIDQCNLDTPDQLQQSNAFALGGYSADVLIGIGAIKLFDIYGEIKRMYIEQAYRGWGIAEKILTGLERYAKQAGAEQVYLETGKLQKAAIRFYQKSGYTEVEKFGHYHPNSVSIFFY